MKMLRSVSRCGLLHEIRLRSVSQQSLFPNSLGLGSISPKRVPGNKNPLFDTKVSPSLSRCVSRCPGVCPGVSVSRRLAVPPVSLSLGIQVSPCLRVPASGSPCPSVPVSRERRSSAGFHPASQSGTPMLNLLSSSKPDWGTKDQPDFIQQARPGHRYLTLFWSN